ncbi:MAG TPA: hypothetical protein PKU91_04595, partial [Phycisphaerales bacterium]|nr:hypothetical protein [Phycisphaerales bacterium]
AVRQAGFLIPGGSGDPFILNQTCITDHTVPILVRLDGTTTRDAAAQLWDSSTHQILYVQDGVHSAPFSPIHFLLLHLAIMLALAGTMALLSGAIHPSRPLSGAAILHVGKAWLIGTLLAGVAAFIPWAMVGPAEYFWASLWWHGQGHDWIIMSHGALWGPFVGAAILYLLAAFRVAKASDPLARNTGPSGADERHCHSCGYEHGSLDTCPECGLSTDPDTRTVAWFHRLNRKNVRRLRMAAVAAVALAILAYAAPLVFGIARAVTLIAVS